MAKDMEHFSMCLFAVCMSSSAKCLLMLYVCFLIVLEILLWNFGSSGYLSDMCFANIFSQSIACLIIHLTRSFTEQIFFNFDEVQFTNLYLYGL